MTGQTDELEDHEWQCPSCGATTRALMADRPPADSTDRDALVEEIAAKVHEAWMETKREQGVESRPSEWGEEQMVAYADLSERAKDLDRSTVRAVLDAQATLGVRVAPDADADELRRAWRSGLREGRATGPARDEGLREQIRRVLDDELANLADDGARLSHSVVRRIEAVLAASPAPARARPPQSIPATASGPPPMQINYLPPDPVVREIPVFMRCPRCGHRP